MGNDGTSKGSTGQLRASSRGKTEGASVLGITGRKGCVGGLLSLA